MKLSRLLKAFRTNTKEETPLEHDSAARTEEVKTESRFKLKRTAKNTFSNEDSVAGADSSILLSGEQAFISLDTHSLDGMIKIATRKPYSPLKKGFYQKNSKTLSVFVYPETLKSANKVKLAVDGYLRLGFWLSHQTKGRPVILLGGDEDNRQVNMEVLIFVRGELVDVVEKQLPPRNALDFTDIVDNTLARLKNDYPNASIQQCPPLANVYNSNINKHHTDKIFKGLRSLSLKQSESLIKSIGLPVCMLTISALYYSYIFLSGFSQHSSLTNEVYDLQDELSSLTQNEVSINVLEARERFKNNVDNESDTTIVNDLTELATSVSSLEGAEIKRLRAPGSAGVTADLALTLPSDSSPSSLIQARSVLDTLVSSSNGYSMRLSQTQSIEESGGMVTFYIEVIDG